MNIPTPAEMADFKPPKRCASCAFPKGATECEVCGWGFDGLPPAKWGGVMNYGGDPTMAHAVAAFNILTARKGDHALTESDGFLLTQLLKMKEDHAKRQQKVRSPDRFKT